jgi:membrane protein DedA with SNARE-associated domain
MLRGKKTAYTLIPAVFMIATTLASLGILLGESIRKKSDVLVAADILLFILALGVVALALKTFMKKRIYQPEIS